MKSLAGANPDAKPDYRTQALSELNKLEQKVLLLNEMLDNVDTEKSEKFAKGDVYDVRLLVYPTSIQLTLQLYVLIASSIHTFILSPEAPEVDFRC